MFLLMKNNIIEYIACSQFKPQYRKCTQRKKRYNLLFPEITNCTINGNKLAF